MVLVIDCGNTALTFAFYVDGQRQAFFYTLVDKDKSVDEWENLLEGLFKKHHVQDCEAILLSSVVPSLNPSIIQAIQKITQKKVIVLSKGFKTGIAIKIDNPNELGTDLVADAVGAVHQYGVPCVIADLGTATKFIGIDKQGSLIGVTIMPGVLISLKALIGKAAQLMDVSLQQPKKILGKNTPDSMNAGTIYGTEALIESMYERIEKEMGYPVKKILTGGYSELIVSLMPIDVIYDRYLNVDGLYQIYLKNKEQFL